jgi:glycosyltransferase involved in cell wall biosynthesis
MRTGLLVPPNDERSLAKAIATLLEDRELGVALSKAGRARVTAEFEIEKSAARLYTIFQNYLQQEPHAVWNR